MGHGRRSAGPGTRIPAMLTTDDRSGPVAGLRWPRICRGRPSPGRRPPPSLLPRSHGRSGPTDDAGAGPARSSLGFHLHPRARGGGLSSGASTSGSSARLACGCPLFDDAGRRVPLALADERTAREDRDVVSVPGWRPAGLRRARKASKMTQADLAARLKVPRELIGRWETSGAPRADRAGTPAGARCRRLWGGS